MNRFAKEWMIAALITIGILTFAVAEAPAQSLWPRTGAYSLYADHRAFQIGDVLTVIVEEEASVTSSAEMNLSKTTADTAKIDTLNAANDILKGRQPEIKADSARSFDGSGEYSLSGSMSTLLTVIVVEVLPNGNLVVEGSRERAHDGEKTRITVSGIVRPEDIAAGNTVYSSSLAQGKIVFSASGPVANSHKQGWLSRLLDFIWPF